MSELLFASLSGGEKMRIGLTRSRFKDSGYTFMALNPGWVNTDLAGEGTGVYVSTVESTLMWRT